MRPETDDDARRRFDALCAAGDFAAAEALVLVVYADGSDGGDEVVSRGEFYEAWGDAAMQRGAPDEARLAYEKAQGFFRLFASWATSGSEGLGRMVDVNRVEVKLGELGA